MSLRPVVTITRAGQRLIGDLQPDEVMLRQLLKWQFPSPTHDTEHYRQKFRVRPFLETLRLAKDCEGLTEEEIALFAIPLIDYRKYKQCRRALHRYRGELDRRNSQGRRRFRRDFAHERYAAIYRETITLGRLRTRQSHTPTAEAFISKKYRNALDYADAAVRYFRATGLFSLSASSSRLTIRPYRMAFVEELLRTFPRDPSPYVRDPEAFLQQFGDPDFPTLPGDRAQVVAREVTSLRVSLRRLGMSPHELARLRAKRTGIKLRKVLEEEYKQQSRQAYIKRLRSGEYLEEITRALSTATTRIEGQILEKSLLLEWNLWRAFETLDRGEVRQHLLLDEECQPLEHASGGRPDMEVFYGKFVLVIEGTLTSGARQHDAEREPIARHYGSVVQRLRTAGDGRPVYGLLIAPTVSDATIAYLFLLRKQDVDHYGGRAKFVPLSLEDFTRFLRASASMKTQNADCAFAALQTIDKAAETARNEREWLGSIKAEIDKLCSKNVNVGTP